LAPAPPCRRSHGRSALGGPRAPAAPDRGRPAQHRLRQLGDGRVRVRRCQGEQLMVRTHHRLRQRLSVEHVHDVLGRQHVADRIRSAWDLGCRGGREQRREQYGAKRTADRHDGLLWEPILVQSRQLSSRPILLFEMRERVPSSTTRSNQADRQRDVGKRRAASRLERQSGGRSRAVIFRLGT